MRLSFSLILPPALALVLGAAMVGQEASAPAPKAEEKPAEAAPAADTGAPSTDVPYSYSVDFGYRAIPSRGGDFQTYRSVLNLGEGPKLFGGTFSYEAPHRLFDRIEIQANDWGGEPYTTGRLYIRKLKLYEFSVNYRDIAYFNAEPSFADPTVLGGVLLNQRSFDTRYRMADVDLTLRPGSRIIPYLAWSHGSRYGNGITTYETDLNEYPVGTLYRDKTDYLRGGVRLEMNRFHVTLEEGGLLMKDDQQVYSNGFSSGNRTTPFFGQQLTLTNALEAYGVRGDGLFSKVLMTGSVTSWLDVYGQFEYSQPSTTVNYFQNAAGNFVNLDSLLFFTREQALLNSQSKEPHTSGSIGFELRPLSRLRIIENVSTDRLHVASSGLLNDTLLPATGDNLFTTTPQGDRYVLNYSQQEVNVIFDVTKKLTIRGGHRYVWGNLETRAPILSEATTESAELKRNVGLARRHLPPYSEAHFECRSGSRIGRPELLPHQSSRLYAGRGPRAISGARIAVPGR